MPYKEVVKSQEKMLKEIYDSPNEAEDIAKAIKAWSTRRKRTSCSITPKKGEIIYVEFGLNYSGEMAYEHPAYVIKAKNSLCVVHPCTSNSSKVLTAYHPTDNPSGNKRMYKLKAGEGGLLKDTAILLNEIQTISYGRIIRTFSPTSLSNIIQDEIDKIDFAYYFQLLYHKTQTTINSISTNNSFLSMNNAILSIENKIFSLKDGVENLKKTLGLTEYEFHHNILSEENNTAEIEIFVTDKDGQESVHKIIKVEK